MNLVAYRPELDIRVLEAAFSEAPIEGWHAKLILTWPIWHLGRGSNQQPFTATHLAKIRPPCSVEDLIFSLQLPDV